MDHFPSYNNVKIYTSNSFVRQWFIKDKNLLNTKAWVVQSQVNPGLVWNLISDLEALKENSV